MSNYKVLITGKILPGYELAQVKQQITKQFKLEDKPEQVALIFGGKPTMVKFGVSQEQARQYQQAIIKAGMECDIVAEEGVGADAVAASGGNQPPIAASKPADAGVEADTYNPYQQPNADLAVVHKTGDFELVEPRKLSATSGWSWLKEGFHYFKLRPVIWIGIVIVFIVLFMVVSVIPIVSLVQNLIFPIFTGGLMLACYKQYRGETIGVGDLFAGFKKNTTKLLAVGLWYLLGTIAVLVVVFALLFMIIGLDAFTQMTPGNIERNVFNPWMWILILIALALFVPLLMGYYFAPALVVFHDMPAFAAMKLSFKGCMRNFMPFLVYGLAAMILLFVAMIPMGLGMLVMAPVLFGSIFAAYRQIYTASAPP